MTESDGKWKFLHQVHVYKSPTEICKWNHVHWDQEEKHSMNANNSEISPRGLMPSESIKIVDHVPKPKSLQVIIPADLAEFHTIKKKRRNCSLKSAGVPFGWKDNLQTFGLWCSRSWESFLYRGRNSKEGVNRTDSPEQALAICTSLANFHWQRKWHGSTISTRAQVT